MVSAAEVAEEIPVFFEDGDVDALASEKKAKNVIPAGPPPTMQQVVWRRAAGGSGIGNTLARCGCERGEAEQSGPLGGRSGRGRRVVPRRGCGEGRRCSRCCARRSCGR